MMLVQTLEYENLFVKLGLTMARERRQNGWVEKTGKKTKTWTGYWYVYVVEGGEELRRQRCQVLGKCAEMTKGGAEDELHKIIRAVVTPTEDATFAEMSAWYLKTSKGLWSPHWYKTVDGFFRLHILPKIGTRPVLELKTSEIQQALNDIAADPDCQSSSMVEKCITQIRAVFLAGIKDELFDRNPAASVVAPPSRRASERFLTLKECRKLLSVASLRDDLILQLFMVLGFRPSELFALRVNDLEPGELRIDETVVGFTVKDQTKTEGSRASVPIPPELEARLRAYIRKNKITDLLFATKIGTAMGPDNYLDRVLKKLGVLAGIDVVTENGKVTSKLNHQVLRRTTGTHFQKHGKVKDAQALLRHADAKTTLKHYQKVLDESLKSGVAGWHEELTRKGPASTEKRVENIEDRRAGKAKG